MTCHDACEFGICILRDRVGSEGSLENWLRLLRQLGDDCAESAPKEKQVKKQY